MRRSKAFTLVELLVAMMLMSVVCVTLFYFVLSSIKLMNKSANIAASSQAVRFVAGRVSSDIIQSAGPSSGSIASRLVIGGIAYEYRDGKVRVEKGSDVYYLTNEGEIKGLKFSYPSSKLVKIEIIPKIGGVYRLNAYARN